MSFSSHTKAEIVWIDDTFGKENAFPENFDFWSDMFGVPEKIYRLLDIKLIMIATYDEAKEYINNIQNNFTTYYFFIVDLTLPKDYEGLKQKKFNSTRGKNLGTLLLDKKMDFAFLSSAGSVGDVRNNNKDLLAVDFYMKNKHTILKLPDPLKNKILLKLQSNVHWINIVDKLYDNISESSNITSNRSDSFSLFPYIDKHKDFINMVEFNNISLDKTLFLKSQVFNCVDFEKQCTLLILSDIILSSPSVEIQFFTLDASTQDDINIKLNELDSLLQDKITNDVIWIIKFRNLEKHTFDKITNRMISKKAIFIINDDEYENYLEIYDMPYNLLELPAFRANEAEQKQNLFKHLLNIKVVDITSQSKNFTIYTDYPELAVDVNTYIALTDPTIHVEEISDSFEVASVVFSLFDKASKKLSNHIKNNKVIEYNDLLSIDMHNGTVKFSDQDIKDIHNNSLLFWLKSSWNFPYGVPIDTYTDIKHSQNWELSSIKILEQQLKKIDNQDDETINNLKSIFENDHILSIIYDKKDKNEVSKLRDITTSLKWPHTQFPMPSILHKKFEEINKHLWFQHNNFNFINYSNDLSDNFNQIEMNLDFYDTTLKFIGSTYKHLPKPAHKFMKLIQDDISLKELSVDNAEFKNEFVKYANVMLRISLVFSELIKHDKDTKNDIDYLQSKHDLDDLDNVYNTDGVDDMASLGTKVGNIRSTFINNDIYTIIPSSFNKHRKDSILDLKKDFEYLNEANSANFYGQYKKILDSLEDDADISDFINGILKNRACNKDNYKLIKSEDALKNYTICNFRSSLSSQFRQSSYAVNKLSKFNLAFKIIKYSDTLLHYNFLADSRNKALVHSSINIDIDFLYESFIFSYESMYLQYEYIIKAIDKKYEPIHSTNYVKFNEKLNQVFLTESDIKSKTDFDEKLEKLFKTKG